MITMHPGEYIKLVYVEEMGITVEKLAEHLQVSEEYLNDIIAGCRNLVSDIAIRLEYVLGMSSESWMEMQMQHDIKISRACYDKEEFKPLVNKEDMS